MSKLPNFELFLCVGNAKPKLRWFFKPKLKLKFELPPRIPKKKSNLFSPFSQIEKEAKDDEDEPPRLEVRAGGPGKKGAILI